MHENHNNAVEQIEVDDYNIIVCLRYFILRSGAKISQFWASFEGW